MALDTKEMKNAFSVMMRRAREPGAFEMLECEFFEEEEDEEYDGEFSLCDHWSMRSYWYDRVFQKAMESIEEAIGVASDLNSSNSSILNRGQDESLVMDSISPTLPLPYTEPASKAGLREITAHFRATIDPEDETSRDSEFSDHEYECDCNDCCLRKKFIIVGFVLKYSDGVETEVGSVRASDTRASLEVNEWQAIVGVQQHQAHENGDVIDQVTFQVRDDDFDTEDFIFGDGKCCSSDDYDYRRLDSYSLGNEKLAMEEGTTLRSLVWSSRSSKIASVLPQKEAVAISDGTSRRRPSIRCRASGTDSSHSLTKQEKKLMGLLSDFRNRHLSQVLALCTAAHKRLLRVFLQSREEALKKLQIDYAHMLDSRQLDSGEIALLRVRDKAERTRILRKRDSLIACARRKIATSIVNPERFEALFRQHNGLYQKFNTQHKALIKQGKAELGSILCKDCFAVFKPEYIRCSRRCQVPFCFDTSPNCGCSIIDCERCHASICHRHRKAHEEDCACSFEKRCGRTVGKSGLRLNVCGRPMASADELNECRRCSVLVCNSCCESCIGRNHSESWCWLNGVATEPRPRRKSKHCTTVLCNACKAQSGERCYFSDSFMGGCCLECRGEESDDEYDEMDLDYVTETEPPDDSLNESMEQLELSTSDDERYFDRDEFMKGT